MTLSLIVFYYLATVSYDLGLKDKAEKYYRQLIDRNPSNADYYNGLVKVLELSMDSLVIHLICYSLILCASRAIIILELLTLSSLCIS